MRKLKKPHIWFNICEGLWTYAPCVGWKARYLNSASQIWCIAKNEKLAAERTNR